MRKVKFGILSTASIGMESVIPALQKSQWCEVTAIASRSPEKAREAAGKLHIGKYYASYEELLADPEIEAVYNPLPNHLHVPWTMKAIKSGKHVLCEKPLALSADEAGMLLEVSKRHPELKVMEAFMYRFHPQWQKAKIMISEGGIGQLKSILSVFTFFSDDPQHIVNHREYGGGGLMDIGCYNISLSRFLFEDEPAIISGSIEYDPGTGVDILASSILTFDHGTSAFTCGIRLEPYQRVHIMGTAGRIEIEWPFNPAGDRETYLFYSKGEKEEKIVIPPANHYTLMGDAFARSILQNTPVPTPLEDAVANMHVLEAVVESGRSGKKIYLK